MKLIPIFLMAALMQVSAKSYSQVNISVRNIPLEVALNKVMEQTGYAFFWDQQLLDKSARVSIDVHNASLKEVLDKLLESQSLTYFVKESDKSVFIRKKTTIVLPFVLQQEKVVKGKVTDESGSPLPGANVIVRGGSRGVITDANGEFELRNVPDKVIISVSMIGYETREVPLNGRLSIKVTMVRKTTGLGEVVVNTGIFNRKVESFTGATATFTGEQLKTIGNQNIVQSLKSLDPSFIVLENNLAGSNPNVLPNMSIQGKTSMIGVRDRLAADPNQPLFILDGFDSDVATIMALDINRIANVTILKDAAATAIYGSKAANGVVVVDTKMPRAGRMNVAVTLDNTVQWADLSGYNMMNAAEKMEFDRLSGYYNYPLDATENRYRADSIYNARMEAVLSGVNTNWMDFPLKKNVMSKNYSVYADGGDNTFRFGLGLKYGQLPGVMKGSSRNTGNANLDMSYRTKKFSFNNKFLFATYTAKESPYGSFATYATGLPYLHPTEDKWLIERLDMRNSGDTAMNPLYIAQLPSTNQAINQSFQNQMQAMFNLNDNFRVEAKFMVRQQTNEQEVFRSPELVEFRTNPVNRKGSYDNDKTRGLSYQGFLQANYGRTWDRHELNVVPGATIEHNGSILNGYRVEGFPIGNFTSPAYGANYPEDQYPSYSKTERRAISGFLNVHYGLDRKYLADVTYRRDGSSVFGSTRRFTDTWTVGLGWNVHNEDWFKNSKYRAINFLKLRASLGNPGNQNFGSYNSFTSLTYATGFLNEFGAGTMVNKWGNPYLAWQKTLHFNAGFDARLLKERLSINFNYYNKNTDPMVVTLPNAPSVGENDLVINIGNMRTTGYDFNVTGTLLSRPKERFFWKANVFGSNYKSVYGGLGNALDILNSLNQGALPDQASKQDYSKINQNLERYVDGGQPDDLWAVRSLGIDPTTGKEMFLTKGGEVTFTYDPADIVKVGNSRPLIQGICGTTVQYGGLSMNINMRYMVKSQQFNSALFNKVENITSSQYARQNADRRALYDRWKKAGDKAQFKAMERLDITQPFANTPMSSRFIQEESNFVGESCSLTYDFYGQAWLKKAGMQGLRLTGYVNDIFRVSNIRRERGIEYPYTRSISFSLNATF